MKKNYVVLFSRHVHQPADEKNDCGSRTAGPAGRDQRLWRSGVRRTGWPLSGGAAGAAGEIHAAGPAKQADKYGIRVEPINMMDYGMQKGAAVLDFALSLIENKN